MSLSTKWKQTHRQGEQTFGCQGGVVGRKMEWKLVPADVSYYTQREQGATVQHRELYSMSYDKP